MHPLSEYSAAQIPKARQAAPVSAPQRTRIPPGAIAFICLARNLCVLLESKLEADEGIVDTKALAEQEKRKREESHRANQAGRTLNALAQSCGLLTQRSRQFIRWLRLSIEHKSPWEEAVASLRPLMARYLAWYRYTVQRLCPLKRARKMRGLIHRSTFRLENPENTLTSQTSELTAFC